MPLRTNKLLQIAQDLYNNPSQEEEYYRSSTNRAYYCIFHTCSEAAVNKLNTTPKQDNFGHDELLRVFNNHVARIKAPTKFDYDIWRVGYLLRQVKDLRVDADYIGHVSFTKSKAADAIANTNEIIRLLQGL